MSEKIILALKPREDAVKAAHLRIDGQTPAVIYGHGKDAQKVSVSTKELERVYNKAGGNHIIGLKVGDARQTNAKIQDVQRDGRTGHLLHADFYLVRMDEKLKTSIPLHFVGESTAVYQQEGTLMRSLETVEIEALPGDLPESIEVDISVLDDFEKTITVADLKIPAKVELLTSVEELVAKVEPPRSDEDMAELDAPIDEEAELPEGVAEDQEVIVEEQQTRKEEQNRADAV